MAEVYHRYDDRTYAAPLDEFDNPMGPSRLSIEHTTYPVLKATPKGVWLDLGLGGRRLVLHASRKRFACSTEEEALRSFIERKKRQAGICDTRAEKARTALFLAAEKLGRLVTRGAA